MRRIEQRLVEGAASRQRLAATLVFYVMATLCAGIQAAAAEEAKAQINALKEIAPGIAKCWTPPEGDGEITLRLSFNRAGDLLGLPRIAFIKADGGADGEVALANTIKVALHNCTPLPFTNAFGAAVAGQVLTIRFVAHNRKTSGPV